MNNFILETEKWFNSDEDAKFTIKNYLDSFEYYPIDKDMFLYDENIVREKLIRTCISSYFKKVEQYIRIYVEDFTFSNYSNFAEFSKNTEHETMTYFLEWFKEENINNIKEFANSSEKIYNLKHLYSVIRYYDFLVKDSLENYNYEATLDFLVDFIYNVMSKTRELTNKEIFNDEIVASYDLSAEIPEANMPINKEHLIIDSNRHIINIKYEIKSADKQTFLLKSI